MKKRYKFLAGLGIVLSAGAGIGLANGLHIDEGVVFQPIPHPDRASLRIMGQDGLRDVRHERIELGGAEFALTTIGPDEGPLIVNCFGNAADRITRGVNYHNKMGEHGQVLLWDYPGYGDTPGTPSVDAIDAAADDLVALAEARAGDRPLVFWGHSLGGFVCSTLASRSASVDALILETTAPSIRSVAKAWTPEHIPLRVTFDEALSRYDSPAVLAEFEPPILVIGAGRDLVLPVELARELADDLDARGRDIRYLELDKANHFSAGFDPQARAAVREMLNALD